MEAVFRDHLIPFLDLRDLVALSLTCKFWHQTLDDLLSVEWNGASIAVPLSKVAFRYLTDNKCLAYERDLGANEETFYISDVFTLAELLALLLNGTKRISSNDTRFLCCYKDGSSLMTLELITAFSETRRAIAGKVTTRVPEDGIYTMCYLLRHTEAMEDFRHHWT